MLAQGTPGPNRFTVMEYNFSLYFGFAVNEYEKLLISDDSPFDRFMEGNLSALTSQEQQGLVVFLGQGRCVNCHGGPELTNASITSVTNGGMLERMIMGDDQIAVYDNGHYNTGVRPTGEDLGIGDDRGVEYAALEFAPSPGLRGGARAATDGGGPAPHAGECHSRGERCVRGTLNSRPSTSKLLARAAVLLSPGAPTRTTAESLIATADALLAAAPPDPTAASAELGAARDALALLTPPPPGMAVLLASATVLLPDPVSPGIAPNLFGPPLTPSERVAVDGAMKTPSIRNAELTAPYFHNGGTATLEQVVDFYNRGGDFAVVNQRNLDVDIQALSLTQAQKGALVAFIKAITDDRVRFEKAPFDHPSLNIPNGGSTRNETSLFGVPVLDDRIEVPAVGASGHSQPLGTPNTPLANFLQSLTP